MGSLIRVFGHLDKFDRDRNRDRDHDRGRDRDRDPQFPLLGLSILTNQTKSAIQESGRKFTRNVERVVALNLSRLRS